MRRDGGSGSGCAGRAELEALVASQAALIVALQARIVEQDARMAVQDARIAELEAQLKASSRNSSRPPSSDGLSKPRVDPKKRSLRRSSGRKQGGQQGHDGARLERVTAPDERVEHPPERCEGCHADLADAEQLVGGESRQVFDLPEGVLLRVVEHVAERRRCGCGHVSSGEFPAGVGAPTQYGPGVRALGVYLCVFQHLPYDRAGQTLADVAGAAVSTGTLTTLVTAAAAGLCDFDERLRGLLVAAPVAHFDGVRLRWRDIENGLVWGFPGFDGVVGRPRGPSAALGAADRSA